MLLTGTGKDRTALITYSSPLIIVILLKLRLESYVQLGRVSLIQFLGSAGFRSLNHRHSFAQTQSSPNEPSIIASFYDLYTLYQYRCLVTILIDESKFSFLVPYS